MLLKDLFALQTAILILTVSNGKAKENRKCYVCVPKSGPSVAEVTQMFPQGPPVPTCDRFDETDTFVRECPSTANYGCLTQTEGKRMTKTCSDIDIEDCKTANKVKYCYCKGDLCNRERESLEGASDDEDFATGELSDEDQGSGFSVGATVGDDDDDTLPSREFSTTSESNFLSTTTDAKILATTSFTPDGKTLNSSSQLANLNFLIPIFYVVLNRLR